MFFEIFRFSSVIALSMLCFYFFTDDILQNKIGNAIQTAIFISIFTALMSGLFHGVCSNNPSFTLCKATGYVVKDSK